MSNERCENCRFAREREVYCGHLAGMQTKLTCRYNAPAVDGWPIVQPSDWCGRHEPKVECAHFWEVTSVGYVCAKCGKASPSSDPMDRPIEEVAPNTESPFQAARRAAWSVIQAGESFNVRTLYSRLQLVGTPVQLDWLSQYCFRWARKGHLEVVVPGRGRTPAVYRKPLTPVTPPPVA